MRVPGVAGFLCAVAAVWAFAADHPAFGATLGLAAIAVGAWAIRSDAAAPTAAVRFDRADLLWALGLGAGALIVRLYRIDEIPWGINNDVAWNGLYALRILRGEQPYTPYTEEAWGKETFFFYLVAGAFRLFGAGPTTLLLPSILCGSLTVGAFYLLSRVLFDRRASVVAAAILATSAWHVTLSRTGYRAILAPLLLALTLLFFFRGVDADSPRPRLGYFVAAGVALGLGHHSYFAFRITGPLLGLLVLREVWMNPGLLRRCAAGLGAMLAAAAALALPLFVYAIAHPDVFFARTGHLWIGQRVREAGSWAPLWENVRDNLSLFHYHARVGNFFNPEWPMLSRPTGALVFVGFGILLVQWRRRGAFVALVVGLLAHLPSVLSAPDATRSLMVTLAIAWAVAMAVEGAAALVSSATAPLRRVLMAAALTAAVAASELHFYFHALGRDPAAQFGYAGLHTAIGRTALDLARHHVTFVSSGHTFTTTEFLWRDVPPGRIVSGGVDSPELVPCESLLAPLEEVAATAPPSGLGLAFVIEAHPANEPLLTRIRDAFPQAVETAHSDPRYGDPAYYSFTVAPPLSSTPSIRPRSSARGPGCSGG